MFTKATIIAALVAIAAAIDPTTQWVGENPTHKPALGENVPAGTPYEVTWTATTSNKISIWLYKGPSIDVKPQFVLAAGIANSGKATITIPKTVENSPGAGYGLQLRDDVTGQFQFTPQFGITGAGEKGTSSSISSTPSGYPTGTPSVSKSSSSPVKNTTTVAPTTVKTTLLTTGTGYPTGSNTTIATRTPTVGTSATSAPSSTTGTGLPQSTGAAGALKAGAALAAGVAGIVAAFI